MIIAGDVGGTNTVLGLFDRTAPRPLAVDVRSYRSVEHHSIREILSDFLDRQPSTSRRVVAASFGVAGPVVADRAQLTNVAWAVDANEVAALLGLARVSLLNDLQAMAHSVSVLQPNELEALQAGQPTDRGNAALIAAGTGLGQALLHRVNDRLVPSPSEGGHADFAARTPREAELAAALTGWYGRARYEDVVSGQGLLNLYRFTHEGRACAEVPLPHDVRGTPPLITKAAAEGRCPACVESLDLFVSAYGAEAGNLALRSVATAGVFLGGGIAPQLLPMLKQKGFIAAFRAKSPMTDLVSRIPVSVILNRRAGLLGAAVHADANLSA